MEEFVGEEIEDGDAFGMDGQPGAEVETGENGLTARSDDEVQLRVSGNKFRTYFH
jgi:hypothetical protein